MNALKIYHRKVLLFFFQFENNTGLLCRINTEWISFVRYRYLKKMSHFLNLKKKYFTVVFRTNVNVVLYILKDATRNFFVSTFNIISIWGWYRYVAKIQARFVDNTIQYASMWSWTSLFHLRITLHHDYNIVTYSTFLLYIRSWHRILFKGAYAVLEYEIHQIWY